MKKLFLAAIAVMITAFSANAQVKIESPHPDLDIKITRCAYASGTVVVDMVLTNFGADTNFDARGAFVSAYDDEGNAYTRDNMKVKLGLTSQTIDNSRNFVLPQDVPLKFRLQLEGISANATKFALIKFPPHYGGSDNNMGLDTKKPIIIRNLEWVK